MGSSERSVTTSAIEGRGSRRADHPKADDIDLASIDWALTTTRAVRRRLDRVTPVPRSVLLECLQVAGQAPTAGGSSRLRWVVVTDPEQRARLAEVYRRADGGGFARAASSARARDDVATARIYEDADWFQSVLHEVPVHVVPCLETDEPLRDLPVELEAAWWGSAFPAVWSFQVALRARGLGSVLTTVHLRRAAETAEVLSLPEQYRQIGLLPVAYTEGTDFRRGHRPPLDDILHWDRVLR